MQDVLYKVFSSRIDIRLEQLSLESMYRDRLLKIHRKEKCLQKLQMVTDVQNGVGVLMVIYRKEKCLQKLQMVTDVQNGVGVN